MLSVIDTGPGIPVAERERVFERFHRGPSRRRRPCSGQRPRPVDRAAHRRCAWRDDQSRRWSGEGRGLGRRASGFPGWTPRPPDADAGEGGLLKVPLSNSPYIASCRPGLWAVSSGEHDATFESYLCPCRRRHRRRRRDGLHAPRHLSVGAAQAATQSPPAIAAVASPPAAAQSSRLHRARRSRRRIRRQHQHAPHARPRAPSTSRISTRTARTTNSSSASAACRTALACARSSRSPRKAWARASS